MVTKKNFEKKTYTTFVKIVSAIGISLVLIICGIIVFYKTHQDASANFADYVMRPLLGNKATIQIESAFFAVQDVFNQVKYHFIKPNEKVFADTRLSSVASESAFTLSPIPVKNPQQGEGKWMTIQSDGNISLLAQTFLRPDPTRDYAITALVKVNMQKLSIGTVAGTWEPGEGTKRGPGMVPLTLQKTNMLLAAFNGGFQKKDGAYGMLVGNITYLPLQNNLATLVIYSDKSPQLFKYEGQKLGNDVTAVRQNGPMLIENGKIVTSTSAWNMQTWGLTTTNSMYTWRSGLGITKTGDLIYAVGPSLVPETLAKALQEAGAIQAMQLDINPVWVRFVLYHPTGNGKYTYQMLLKDMSDGGLAYLTGYQKDFFYVYKKQQPVLSDVKKIPLTIFNTKQQAYTRSKNSFVSL